jgi:RES domain-containing protein
MATVWRLAPSAFAHALDGEGASLAGGRWNSRGVPALYTSSQLSLCVLEVLVNIPPPLRDDLPALEAVRLSIPDDAGTTEIGIREFEAMLASADPLRTSRAIGDDWIAKGHDLVLAAPSVVVPEESNFMLNPAHPRMGEVAIVATRRFRFDARLFAARAGNDARPRPAPFRQTSKP